MSKSSLIQEIVDKCQHFNQSGFDSNVFNELINLVERLKSKDLNFILSQYQFNATKPTKVYLTPVYYDEYTTIVIYVLKANCTIPIHDHPEMYSILKVLDGKLKVVGYSQTDVAKSNGTVPVKQSFNRVIGTLERSQITTPRENYHSLTAFGGSVGYIDILVPPYIAGVRERSEYELVNPFKAEPGLLTLKKCNPQMTPSEEVAYKGPQVAVSNDMPHKSGSVPNSAQRREVPNSAQMRDPPGSAQRRTADTVLSRPTSTTNANNSNGFKINCPNCDTEFNVQIKP